MYGCSETEDRGVNLDDEVGIFCLEDEFVDSLTSELQNTAWQDV